MGSPLERFLDSISIDSDTGCWLWTRSLQSGGYAELSVDGRRVLAHRFSYEYFVGPIPDGLDLDHVHERGCRHKHCVNPDHLEPVTHQENIRRAKALIEECPAGHPYDEANTTIRRGSRECRACNRERVARFKQAHPERASEIGRSSYAANREQINERRRARYQQRKTA